MSNCIWKIKIRSTSLVEIKFTSYQEIEKWNSELPFEAVRVAKHNLVTSSFGEYVTHFWRVRKLVQPLGEQFCHHLVKLTMVQQMFF